ncbi:hypothetical protein MJO29_011081 [Puccinia striiformis f. sp. tritici]|nr:hypothetical protein MJO29_011081 [Puccinia striiformis f. sp. tritici]
MQDFLCGPASPTVQSCNSGPTLQTLDLLQSKKPAMRSLPDMDSDGATSLNDLRNAGRELRLPPIDQSVARIQDPTYLGEHDILASNFQSLSSTDFRETHSLVDNLDREVRSGLPRHDISVNCDLRLAPSPAETTRGESAAPSEYSMMIPPYNRPETAIILLAKFGMSPDTETTDTHEFRMSSTLPSAHSQLRLKRPMVNNCNHNNPDVHGEPIDHLARCPADKKAKIYAPWSRNGQKPLIQHPPEPPASLVKSNSKKTDVFPSKEVVSGVGMASNESKPRGGNPHRIALVNHYDNNLKDKYLTSSSEARIESLDFNLDTIVAEGPSRIMKEALRMTLEPINLQKGNKIILTLQEAANVFAIFHKNQYGPMTGKDSPPYHFSQNLMRTRLLEVGQSQENWFKFWERISGINFEEELRGKVALNSNEQTLLLYFMFYVDMIDTIIPPSKPPTSLKNHKYNLYRDALIQFVDFKENDQAYKSMDIENVILFNSYRSIWNSIFHWLSKGERSDLKRLAFSGQGRGSRGFKNFFDLTFKLTSGSLTNRLNPGPKLAQHL